MQPWCERNERRHFIFFQYLLHSSIFLKFLSMPLLTYRSSCSLWHQLFSLICLKHYAPQHKSLVVVSSLLMMKLILHAKTWWNHPWRSRLMGSCYSCDDTGLRIHCKIRMWVWIILQLCYQCPEARSKEWTSIVCTDCRHFSLGTPKIMLQIVLSNSRCICAKQNMIYQYGALWEPKARW